MICSEGENDVTTELCYVGFAPTAKKWSRMQEGSNWGKLCKALAAKPQQQTFVCGRQLRLDFVNFCSETTFSLPKEMFVVQDQTGKKSHNFLDDWKIELHVVFE